MTIKRNAIQCNYCQKILESTHVHDFRTHRCEKGPQEFEKAWIDDPSAPGGQRLVETTQKVGPWMMVDGGKEYIRRGGDPKHYTVLDE